MIRLATITARIENHISKAQELVKEDLSNEVIFNALAMHCFQAVNAAIDLGELIVSEKKLGFPSKYKEIFELVADVKIINKKTLDDIKRLVFLRNLVAHEYYIITKEELKEMATLLKSFDELIKYVKDDKLH